MGNSELLTLPRPFFGDLTDLSDLIDLTMQVCSPQFTWSIKTRSYQIQSCLVTWPGTPSFFGNGSFCFFLYHLQVHWNSSRRALWSSFCHFARKFWAIGIDDKMCWKLTTVVPQIFNSWKNKLCANSLQPSSIRPRTEKTCFIGETFWSLWHALCHWFFLVLVSFCCCTQDRNSTKQGSADFVLRSASMCRYLSRVTDARTWSEEQLWVGFGIKIKEWFLVSFPGVTSLTTCERNDSNKISLTHGEKAGTPRAHLKGLKMGIMIILWSA